MYECFDRMNSLFFNRTVRRRVVPHIRAEPHASAWGYCSYQRTPS